MQFVRGLLKVENEHVAGQNAGLPEHGLQRETEQVVLVGQRGEDEDRRALQWTASRSSGRWRTDVERFVDDVIFLGEKLNSLNFECLVQKVIFEEENLSFAACHHKILSTCL